MSEEEEVNKAKAARWKRNTVSEAFILCTLYCNVFYIVWYASYVETFGSGPVSREETRMRSYGRRLGCATTWREAKADLRWGTGGKRGRFRDASKG